MLKLPFVRETHLTCHSQKRKSIPVAGLLMGINMVRSQFSSHGVLEEGDGRDVGERERTYRK